MRITSEAPGPPLTGRQLIAFIDEVAEAMLPEKGRAKHVKS